MAIRTSTAGPSSLILQAYIKHAFVLSINGIPGFMRLLRRLVTGLQAPRDGVPNVALTP
jgi:hypothetical protein